MTDTIDVAALVERLKRRQESRWDGVSQDHEWVPDADCVAAATALQSQADALAEARRENEALRGETFLASAEAAEHHRDNAIKMWDEERKLRTTAEASLATMREALEPFASFARNNTDDDGWAGTQCQRERIVDWFGPSDFIDARRALGGSIGIPLMTERVPASQGAAQDD